MMSIAILYIQDSTRLLSCNEGMDGAVLGRFSFSTLFNGSGVVK